MSKVLRRGNRLLLLAGVSLACWLNVGVAFAAEGNIDHVEPADNGVQILFSVPGEADLSGKLQTRTTIAGQQVAATASLATSSDQKVERTVVLALDTSESMRGDKFAEAKRAALQFAEAAPADLSIGLVTFDNDVAVSLEPTLDRQALLGAMDALTLATETRLHDGIVQAIDVVGDEGQRSVLVLSDGADTSNTPLDSVTEAISDSDVLLDVIALAQNEDNLENLGSIAAAGQGEVLEADDPAALGALFAREGDALARQVLVSADLPAGFTDTEANVEVSLTTTEATYQDSAFATVALASGATRAPDQPAPAEPTTVVSRTVMLLGLGAAGIAVGLILLMAFGVLPSAKEATVADHISVYGHEAARLPAGKRRRQATGSEGLTASAKELAERALRANKGLDASLATQLDAAGLSVKPAEWILIQVGLAFVAALIGLLLGTPLVAVLILAASLVLPYLYLLFKKRTRVRAFNDQLPDTLQLMAGSLAAGLSFAQSADTVVREGSEPMTAEFKRALVEARLGVQLEDALENVAARMQSADFKWVVLAVRIQREVGGNLAEVLNQVADTIRERAYLRRQVKTLSAEGVLSAWILGALPPAMFVYFLMVRAEYMQPMFEEPIGWAMLGGGALLMAIGAFWMNRLVKIEV